MIWNIDPILLDLGPLEIRYYGVFYAIALASAYFLGRSMCMKRKINPDDFDNLVVYLVAGLILGARLGHVFFYSWDYYSANPLEILQIWKGGLSSHGGVIGTFLMGFLYFWQHKTWKRFFEYADIVAIVSSILVICVRLGNFFNSEIVGRPSDLPWAVTFERVDLIARHPVQLYEALAGGLLLAVFYPLWIKLEKTWRPGVFLGLFLIAYFTLRFLLEFTKDLAIHEKVWGLTTGQLLSLPFIGAGLILFLLRSRK